MSALTPHIRVLRAEAEAIRQQAVHARDLAAEVLFALSKAKTAAADQLEAEEAELASRLDENSEGVHYNRKGKPPPGASER